MDRVSRTPRRHHHRLEDDAEHDALLHDAVAPHVVHEDDAAMVDVVREHGEDRLRLVVVVDRNQVERH